MSVMTEMKCIPAENNVTDIVRIWMLENRLCWDLYDLVATHVTIICIAVPYLSLVFCIISI